MKQVKYKEGYLILSDDEIKEDDVIYEQGKHPVICKKILGLGLFNTPDLTWESLDKKSGACDNVDEFKKVIGYSAELADLFKGIL